MLSAASDTRSLRKAGNTTCVETLIIGGGPAGLQLAYFLEARGRDYLVLERNEPGAFFERFPRHRMLISINKLYTGYDDPEKNLRWDWNSLLCDDAAFRLGAFTDEYFPQADDLVKYLRAFAEKYPLRLRSGVEATRIEKVEEGGFVVHCNDGTRYGCERLVLATGLFEPYLPPIEGIELAEPYTTVSTDRSEFRGKRVLIVGKGNSAFETADHLVSVASAIHVASPHPVRMAWKSRFVGDLRAVNNNFLDTYRLKAQNVVIDAAVARLRRVGDKIAAVYDYVHAPGEIEEILYDRVIACTGFRMDTSLFDEGCRPELIYFDKLPEQTSEWESVNVPHLYFAGVLMQARDYKRTMSAFIHGFRYNVRALFEILEQKYHGVPIPSSEVAADAEAMTSTVIERVNTASGLWQQPGFLGDVLVKPQSGPARLYRELPVEWIHESGLAGEDDYYIVTLNFGPSADDPFNFERPHRDDAESAAESEALHPVVRRYRAGQLVSEHHAIEDIAAEWDAPVHVEPLKRYFENELADRGPSKPRVA